MTDAHAPDTTSAGRHLIAVTAGVLLVGALLAFPLDLGNRPRLALVSERVHARIEAVTPGTDTALPLAEVVFLDGRLAGQKAQAPADASGSREAPAPTPG